MFEKKCVSLYSLNKTMMLKKLFISAALVATCVQMNAQNAAPDYKGSSNNNPISASVFCADPTALEYKGRLYVYGSNDHQQFIKNGKKGDNGYGDIKSLVVFSTDDLVNWTFHGTIDVAKLCASWTGNPWYKGFMNSWAPSVTWRTAEDGTDEFFLYFANTSHGVGVLQANSPVGPWKSPLKESMINRDTPGVLPCNWIFDPGVMIDEDGTGWISFGGGDPNSQGSDLQPNNACLAKLKPSMTALDGKPIKIPAPYHFEASELNVIGGKYVYTYCSSWATRNDNDWNTYKQEQGISVAKPGACTMCYMVSDNPMDPASWKYKGVYGPHPGTSANNHSHLHKFQGKYYHIYHSGALLKSMKDAKAVDESCGTYRSICVNKATVSEGTQSISAVTLDLAGVTAIKNMNPYEWQEAETMATCGGISYENFSNIKKNTRINTLGNDASENIQVKMEAGSWISQRGLDFGEKGAAKFTLRVKGTGTMGICIGRPVRPAATIEFSSAEMEEHAIELDASRFNGVKNIFFSITSGDNIFIDAWQFTEADPDGILDVESGSLIFQKSYDLFGRSLSDTSHQGIVIEQYTDENGITHSRKRYISHP